MLCAVASILIGFAKACFLIACAIGADFVFAFIDNGGATKTCFGVAGAGRARDACTFVVDGIALACAWIARAVWTRDARAFVGDRITLSCQWIARAART